ncbi:iron chelate uptake ABC transporter family permease subunit [Microbacterium sp. No. 7]|uniref:iron chelate uptake ABC transporter family permease subunit n=1 Tax=Microbacterium sp. No. 7 TaxID=1714373 RepID=UPI0006ECE372|nr:iron chelate uptake ABC transporter family permease subunit [Microbacterium sp. No. 7]ALJ21541.1 enterochelin ABC transporter permease [Microbacterium sp. No. 7]
MPADALSPHAQGVDAPPAASARRVGPYTSQAHRLRYLLVLTGLIVAAVAITVLLLSWGNQYEPFSERWWRISRMRVSAIIVIALVTFCQSIATVTFQTATNNRIITPSIMGFESLYVLLQTSIVFFFGTTGLVSLSPFARFLLQSALMVLFAVLLYSWLLSGRFGNLHVMLLVGIIIGTGMGALSTFMQQMLDPNEFDVLTARLFGNIGNANTDFLWFVIPVCALAGGTIWLLARRLNVIALGADISTNVGLRHRREIMLMLTLVSVLMAMSTSLIGPMTFLGFLVATLAYAITDTYDHRRILPVAWLLGFVVLAGAYFLLRHVFQLVDAVTIIVELIGGLVFLIVILRKGRL